MSSLAARLNEIHQRLSGGSRTASKDLFLAALNPITAYLLRAVRGLTPEDAHDCATESIARHLEHPERFDPGKGSLWAYLCRDAEGDARDKVRRYETRENLLEKAVYEIELWGAQSNNDYGAVENRIDAERIIALHGSEIVQDEAEGHVLRLMLDGERSVAAYAEALGLDLEAEDVADEVKRVKDRINLRLKKVRDEL